MGTEWQILWGTQRRGLLAGMGGGPTEHGHDRPSGGLGRMGREQLPGASSYPAREQRVFSIPVVFPCHNCELAVSPNTSIVQ